MGVALADQAALDERVLEDADLEAALEEREAKKERAGQARKAYKDQDDIVKGDLDQLGLDEDEVVRVGRFRVELKSVPSRSVSFETSPSTRLAIKAVDGE